MSRPVKASSQVILSRLELPAILEALSDQLQAGLGYTVFFVWLFTQNGEFFRSDF